MKRRNSLTVTLGTTGVLVSSLAFGVGHVGGGAHAGSGMHAGGGFHAAAPVHHAAPVFHAPPPVHHNPPPPVHHNPPPVHNNPPPVHHNPPPVHNNPPPVHHNPPPVHTNPPPVHHNPPPVHTNPPPVHTNPPPVHHNPPVQPSHPTQPGHTQPTQPSHPTQPGHTHPTQPSQPSHTTPISHHQPVAPVTHRTELPRGGEVRRHEDGSKSFVRPNGSQKIEHRDGHVSYADHSGHVTKVVFGGTKVEYHNNGSKTIISGNRTFNQHITINNNIQVMQRNYVVHNSFINHPLEYRAHYESHYCSFWRTPVLFYSTALALGALDYTFFGPSYYQDYRPVWGYNYWNNYRWDNDYGWYHHYSSFYWKPYGYWERQYRPSYALVDWLFGSTLDYAWQERMEAAREAARQANEDRAMQAASDDEAARIRAIVDEEVQAAVQVALDNAKATAAAQDASQGPLIDQTTQAQFAGQIEQISNDRKNGVSIDAAFDAALKDSRHLFLVQTNSDKTYDDGNSGQCRLSAGDVLQQDPNFDTSSGTGLLGLRVKVGHPDSCRAGSTIIMTAEDLAAIYNALHEQMDVGAKQLAEANQPAGTNQPVSVSAPDSDPTVDTNNDGGTVVSGNTDADGDVSGEGDDTEGDGDGDGDDTDSDEDKDEL